MYGDKDYSNQLPDLKDESTETNVYTPTRRTRPKYQQNGVRRRRTTTSRPSTSIEREPVTLDFSGNRNRQII